MLVLKTNANIQYYFENKKLFAKFFKSFLLSLDKGLET